jgi:hypothetical protein
MLIKPKMAAAALVSLLLLGCSRQGEISTAGVTVLRSACPSVAIPMGTGDVTLFDPETSRDSTAIDVVASITNLRSTCTENETQLVTNANFEVRALRRDPRGARDVTLPYFATVVQGGNNVTSKSVSRVALHFADGELRASTSGAATSQVSRSAATLPADIRREITRERKSGEEAAAIDPMADPKVRAAVQRSSFELLVGFQLTPDQLAYNMTR